MPKLDLDAIPQTKATGYPAPYDAEVQERWYRRLGPVAGLTHLGASHVVLKPDAYSSQRHWHRQKDELPRETALSQELIERSAPIARRRVLQAGLRMAEYLDRAFEPGPLPEPAR